MRQGEEGQMKTDRALDGKAHHCSAKHYLILCPATIIKACSPAVMFVTQGQTINQN